MEDAKTKSENHGLCKPNAVYVQTDLNERGAPWFISSDSEDAIGDMLDNATDDQDGAKGSRIVAVYTFSHWAEIVESKPRLVRRK